MSAPAHEPQEPPIRIDLRGIAEPLRSLTVRQHDAFIAPRADALLAALKDAGLSLSRPAAVVFDAETGPGGGGVAPDDPAWSRTLPGEPRPGLELLERVLVQLIDDAGDTPQSAMAHALATEVIREVVDPTHVSSLVAGQARAPGRRPARVPRRPRRALFCSIAANAHDSSVALADEHEVLVVLEAERVHRRKRKWCDGTELERLVERALAGISRDPDDVTHWTGTAMMNGLLPEDRRTCAWTEEIPARILGRSVVFKAVNHHLAHAAMAFAEPPGRMIAEACDGGGDGRRYAAFSVDGTTIEPLDAPSDPLSGAFYDICSYYLYKTYGQEGKMMGLAAYGRPDPDLDAYLARHAELLSFGTHEDAYAVLDARLGIARHDTDDPRVRDAAMAAQRVFVERRVRQVSRLVGSAGASTLVLTGGAALNIHANSAIADALPDCTVHIPPCCDDTGQALGALLHTAVTGPGARPRVDLPFLGEGTPDPPAIDATTVERVVDDLLADQVVAWHYGRAEIGPRALGHRSLLSVASTAGHRVNLSEQIKRRAAYRPVAPVVLADRLGDWFTPARPSPYMLFAAHATDLCRRRAPAVVHIDGSARVQTVDRDAQPLGPILAALEARTGVPLLINTSLNGPGEPIANTPDDTLAFARRHPGVVPWIDGRRAL